MMDEFLTLVEKESILEDGQLHPGQMGNYIYIYNGSELEMKDYNIAFIGVQEDRGSTGNTGSAKAPDLVRRELYQLFMPPIEKEFKVIDLGNIREGETLRDTHFALSSVILVCLTHKVIPVVIGGSHDLTFGQYLGYKNLHALINLVILDEKIDMLDDGSKKMNSSSFLMNILTHTPNYLFNYSHIGYQTYLNDSKAIEILEGLNFDCHRLGLIRANLEQTEPILRDADALSIDISCIRQADAPAHAKATPNGFSGEELCQITRYAGLSDKLSSLGIYEINPGYDNNFQTAKLAAQMIWYFMEGYYSRVGDYPLTLDEHLKFTVRLDESDHELIFWKSKRTERWWMELPFGDKEKFGRHQLVPCSFQDYEMACEQELPDRWMKAYTKLT